MTWRDWLQKAKATAEEKLKAEAQEKAISMPAQPKCTYCGGTLFYEGPSGGMATNVLCANVKCRHWFNLSPFGLDDLERVEPTEEERVKLNEAHRKDVDAERLAWRYEGRQAFVNGLSSATLITDYTYSPFVERYRFAGFLDAMAEQVRRSRR